MTGKAGATPDFIVDRPCPTKATPSPGKGNMTARTAGIFHEPYKRGKNEREQEHGSEQGWGHDARQSRDIDCRLRSEEHTSELQSLMRISYAVFCLKKQKK